MHASGFCWGAADGSADITNPQLANLFLSIQRMVCTGCGSEANASCNCGVAYTPKIVRAAEAIKANPQKSDRAIAADIGVSHPTVAKARSELGGNNLPPDRIGQDSKSYSIRQRRLKLYRAGEPLCCCADG